MRKFLENVSELQLKNFEELKSMVASCTQDSLQKGEPLSYTRLQHMVHTHLDQQSKDRHFNARNDDREERVLVID